MTEHTSLNALHLILTCNYTRNSGRTLSKIKNNNPSVSTVGKTESGRNEQNRQYIMYYDTSRVHTYIKISLSLSHRNKHMNNSNTLFS